MFAASKTARAAAAGATSDPYFMYVPLLLNTTSTNGQQNNTFLDSSTNNFTITRNGTPTQGSFTPYQPSGYWSGYFNGSSDGLSVASNAVLGMGAGDFTVEAWIYFTANIPYLDGDSLYSACLLGQPVSNGLCLVFKSGASSGTANKLTFTIFGVSSTDTTISTSLNTWYHVAVVRQSGTVRVFLNGVQQNSFANSTTFATSASTIGYLNVASFFDYFPGYISNFRMVKGVAVYTGAFTPPTAPLAATQSAGTNISAITGTQCSLLTCSSNRFIDIGGQVTPNVITVNGTPKVQAFQPFSPAASYSAATYGGSGYFDGASALSLSANAAFSFSTGDFCIEAFVFVSNNNCAIVDTRSSDALEGYLLFLNSTRNLSFIYGATSLTSASSVTANQWTHIAVTRSSGVIRLFINGVLDANTVTYASAINATSFPSIGGGRSSGTNTITGYYLNGYISNFRMVKGSAIYTSAFTPPTLPVTAVSGTSLLTNFTNAGIYDAAWQNNALTVGDAQASTTQYKWSPTSMKFDGTGDYLDILGPNPAFNLSSGDWTIEAWIYRNATGANHCILNLVNSFSGNAGLTFYVNSSNQLVSDNGTVAALAGGSVPANQWVYVAITRSSGTTTGYVNGTSIGTNTQAPSTAQYARIGALGLGTFPFNGYIQDLRITKGVARTITTPTAAFPTR